MLKSQANFDDELDGEEEEKSREEEDEPEEDVKIHYDYIIVH
jgi:hypothetical protein